MRHVLDAAEARLRMNIVKQRATVLSNEMISAGIYSMWLENRAASLLAKPGQFISVYCEDKSRLLPRPISICGIEKEKGELRLVYRIAVAQYATARNFQVF